MSFFKILLLWKCTGYETLELNNSKGGFVDKFMGLMWTCLRGHILYWCSLAMSRYYSQFGAGEFWIQLELSMLQNPIETVRMNTWPVRCLIISITLCQIAFLYWFYLKLQKVFLLKLPPFPVSPHYIMMLFCNAQ